EVGLAHAEGEDAKPLLAQLGGARSHGEGGARGDGTETLCELGSHGRGKLAHPPRVAPMSFRAHDRSLTRHATTTAIGASDRMRRRCGAIATFPRRRLRHDPPMRGATGRAADAE